MTAGDTSFNIVELRSASFPAAPSRREFPPDVPLRLFCFPWSGASASAFRPLASSMPAEIEAVGVRLPSRGECRDEHASGRLEVLAGNVARAIRAELSARPRPFAFFGHSLGALFAYEVARRLSPAGWRPELVVLSGSRAPSRRPRVVLHTESDAQLLDRRERCEAFRQSRQA